MTYFVSLKITALIIGLIYVLCHLPLALAPVRLTSLAKSLPRNYPLGVVLMLAATIWFTWLTGSMDLGELSNMRVQLMIVWTLAGVLVIIFVPGFLAMRGLGCLLLLGAAVILDAAFLVTSPWRFVMTLLAYGWVIKGMVLVYSPHLGRDGIAFLTRNEEQCRVLSWAGVIFGVLVIALALLVY